MWPKDSAFQMSPQVILMLLLHKPHISFTRFIYKQQNFYVLLYSSVCLDKCIRSYKHYHHNQAKKHFYYPSIFPMSLPSQSSPDPRPRQPLISFYGLWIQLLYQTCVLQIFFLVYGMLLIF